jgi:hypothetical protein
LHNAKGFNLSGLKLMGTNKVALNAGHHVDIMLVNVNASFSSDIVN